MFAGKETSSSINTILYIVLAILVGFLILQILFVQSSIKEISQTKFKYLEEAKAAYMEKLSYLENDNHTRTYAAIMMTLYTNMLANALLENKTLYKDFTNHLDKRTSALGLCNDQLVQANGTFKDINFMVVENSGPVLKLLDDIYRGRITKLILQSQVYEVIQGLQTGDQDTFQKVLEKHSQTMNPKYVEYTNQMATSRKLAFIPLVPYSYEYIDSELFSERRQCKLPIVNFISPGENNYMKSMQEAKGLRTAYLIKSLDIASEVKNMKVYMLGFKTNIL